eukprot:TRINITY_DN35885_c0_g1_i1.p1 TRINITY_DN35885_c0_g1~~TRINITY_DN35885_c0_g1_i1.p1  ORF type:complete len:415 (+),score=141.34 TRINITY_DN35885_c0_g1_i1:41-1246(+)
MQEPSVHEAEAHCSVLVCAPFDSVWSCVADFDAVGGLLAEDLECCVIDNGMEPRQVGAVRRMVFRLRDGERDDPKGQSRLLREQLDAYFDSPCKRFYTCRLLPYDDCFEGRSPLPCDVEFLISTLSAAPVTDQEKCYVELYSTFGVRCRDDVPAVRQWLDAHFRRHLDCLRGRFAAHVGDTLPSVLVRMSADEALEPYQADLDKVIAVWRASMAAERNMLQQVALLRSELADTQRILGANVSQHQSELKVAEERAAKAEAELSQVRTDVVDAVTSPAPPPDRTVADPPPVYYSGQAEDSPRTASPSPDHSPKRAEIVFGSRASTAGVCITEEQIRQKFEELDVNGNGWLTRDELRAFYTGWDNYGVFETDDTVERLISRYLRDGRVTLPEFSLLMLRLAQR